MPPASRFAISLAASLATPMNCWCLNILEEKSIDPDELQRLRDLLDRSKVTTLDDARTSSDRTVFGASDRRLHYRGNSGRRSSPRSCCASPVARIRGHSIRDLVFRSHRDCWAAASRRAVYSEPRPERNPSGSHHHSEHLGSIRLFSLGSDRRILPGWRRSRRLASSFSS